MEAMMQWVDMSEFFAANDLHQDDVALEIEKFRLRNNCPEELEPYLFQRTDNSRKYPTPYRIALACQKL